MPPLRIASVPAGHPYVAHLGTTGVVRLPDPEGGAPGQWWPPAILDPGWIAAHAADFDVLHLHFGAESFPPAHLAAVLAALRRAGRPLLYTVHDLENPQLADQEPHHAQLDVLLPGADALVTLTAGAAAAIAAGWGREAEVLPHPHLLPLDAPLPAVAPGGPPVVGLHLRDLRPNVDGPGAVATAVAAVEELRAGGEDVRLRVELGDRVRDEAARSAVRSLCAPAWVTLVEAPRASDAELHAGLAALDACVLPYRHGTHSGWLELCWDLGVPVAAPRVGCFAEQHAEVASFTRGSAPELAQALRELVSGDRPRSPTVVRGDRSRSQRPGTAGRAALVQARRAWRRTQAAELAAAHLALYERVVSAAAARRAPAAPSG